MFHGNNHPITRGAVVMTLVMAMLLTNFPPEVLESGFGFLRDAIRDRRVVDTLYLTERASRDRHIADNFFIPRADAAVASLSARTFYGVTNNTGRLMWATGASNSTGAEIAGPVGTASAASFVRAYHAPTRDEIMAGIIKADGALAVSKIVNGQDAAGDGTLQFDRATVTSAQTCDATTFGSCWRAFDIGYEQLSGEAMVAFASSTAGRLGYYIWDGTSWSPATTTSPSTTSLGGSGAIRWVRLIPRGEGLKGSRSNEILAVVSDANSDIFAGIWNGSSWTATTTITTTASTFQVQNFDGAWEETTGDAMVVWSDGTSATTTPYRYKKWTRSSATWASTGTALPAIALSSIGHWVSMKGAPISGKNHIALITNSGTTLGNNCSTGTNCRSQAYIWDGSSFTIGNQWASREPLWEQVNDVGIESLNTNVQAFFIGSLQSTTDVSGWQTWIEGTGFSSITDIGTNMGDDAAGINLTSHPNINEIYATAEDVDADCNGGMWGGVSFTGWDSTGCNSSGEAALAPASHTAEPGEGMAFWVAAKPYSPWSRNWRFYGDITENDPDNASDVLGVSENAAPSIATDDFIRLRFQFGELAGLAQTDARKKLQWTTQDPDISTSTWTDVADIASTTDIWRYASTSETCANCGDNTAIGAQRLTGTTQSGTYLSLKNDAAGTNMDHTALALVEYDYPLKAEAATSGLTYYFRAWDNDQLAPVFREQDSDGSNDCSAAACTYPSVSVTTPVITASSTGTQTATTSIPSVDFYVGGAFNFVRSSGSANITSITITDTGTISANADLSDLRLFYKQEATCSTSIPGDATAFNSTGMTFNGSEQATATGTMAIGTSQVCVYVRVDVGSGASADETIEIQITDPSTEVTASAGTVTPASAVTIPGTTTLSAVTTVSCNTNISSTSFGTLSSGSITTASPNASTTMSCSNTSAGCSLTIQGAGNGVSPGLATTSPAYLIPSTTATLSAGTEGYGIQATTTATGSGGTLTLNSLYNKIGNAVGALSLSAITLASSTVDVTNREVVVPHLAAISTQTQAGSYVDTITYSCTAN